MPFLNRRLNRNLDCLLTRRTDGHPYRRKNPLREICRLLEQYLKLRKHAARRDPHLFGPHAHRYYADTLAEERRQREIELSLQKVYGPPRPGEDYESRQVWRERYEIQPGRERLFRKWFKENYGH